MKHGNIEILDLDFEYKLWKNKIAYMISEVELLVDRIHVLKREHLSLKFDDSFMKLLDIQTNALKQTAKSIRTHEQEIAFYAEDYPIIATHSHYVVHENIRNEMDKIINRHQDILSDIYPKLCFPIEFP